MFSAMETDHLLMPGSLLVVSRFQTGYLATLQILPQAVAFYREMGKTFSNEKHAKCEKVSSCLLALYETLKYDATTCAAVANKCARCGLQLL